MLRRGSDEKFKKKKEVEEVSADVSIISEEELAARFDMKPIEEWKEKMRGQAKSMLAELDIRHAKLRDLQYYPCVKNKCTFQNQESIIKVGEVDQKFTAFVPHGQVEQVETYNNCVKDCQEDLRSSRFMVEFQLKEW